MNKIDHTHKPQTANLAGVRSRLFGGLFAAALASCLLASAHTASADTTFQVNSIEPWEAFINVTGTNGFGDYFFGSPWAIEDLTAGFVKTNTNPSGFPINDYGFFDVNTNTYDTGDIFWNDPTGVPQKYIEANYFVSNLDTNVIGAGGQTITFAGTIISNTIPTHPFTVDYNTDVNDPSAVPPTGKWFVVAFVKEFSANPDGGVGGFLGSTTTAQLTPGAFSVSRPIAGGNRGQYGFIIYGGNTAPGTEGTLTFEVEDADPGFATQPADVEVIQPDPISLTAVAVGSTPPSLQWQLNGTNLVDGGAISGATTTNLVIDPSTSADAGDYRCIASNTVGTATSFVASASVVTIIISEQPQDQRVEVGSDAVFSVAATGSVALIYRWYWIDPAGPTTNFLALPGSGIPTPPSGWPVNYSGAITDTLTITNCQLVQDGLIGCRIYDGTDFNFTDSAQFLVRTPAEYVNFLENWGFENGKGTNNEPPWVRYADVVPGPNGDVLDATDTYPFPPNSNVNVLEGTYVSFTGFHQVWSGIYQDVAVEPGMLFVAKMSFYNSSEDPIPGPNGSFPIAATNVSYLEVQFRDAGDAVLEQYTTDLDVITSTNPPPEDTWFELVCTNAGDFGSGTPTDGLYLEAPSNAVVARFQVTMNDLGNSGVGGVANGSLYYDAGSLRLVRPVGDLSIVEVGGNTEVSWESRLAQTYQVQYQDTSVSNGPWTNLGGPEAGTGAVIAVTDVAPPTARYYRVLTL